MKTRSFGRAMAIVGALGVAALVLSAATSACGDSGSDAAASEGGPSPFDFDATPESSVRCTNLECQIKDCIDDPAGTRIVGRVYDPSGTRPVFNAVVYVPNEPLAPLDQGASCERCDRGHSGAPLRITRTDAAGRFELDNVPTGEGIPLVVQIGKWRRSVLIPEVPLCTQTIFDVRLPRNRSEGDIPRMALTTGADDPLPCLLRKIGIDDGEIGVAGTDARIHLYRGGGYDDGDGGAPHTASGSLTSGTPFPSAESLWNDGAALAKYDAVLLACEGAPNDDAVHKSPAAKQALYDYAKAGGRVLATHHHHTFFSGSPDPAPRGVAAWSDRPGPAAGDPHTTAVDVAVGGAFPRAVALSAWLGTQNALTDAGTLTVFDTRHQVDGVDAGALAWLSAQNPSFPAAPAVQHLTFGAPIGARADQVCGRVAYTNVHFGPSSEASLADDATKPFPESCRTKDLTAQQKALEFMLFELLSCAADDGATITTPH
jgi:hypothetical protein